MKQAQRYIRWSFIILVACSVVSCKVKRPETVMSDDKMEAVLYDYHIAKAMGEQVPYNESYKRILYVEHVYKKHGITEAQFDSSMVWFARNPEVLRDIYERVNKRLKEEKEQIDNLIAKRDHKPKMSKPGDSIDVWAWQRIYRLTGMPLNSRVWFTLPSDTNFHDRDTLRWSMRFRYEPGALSPADTLYAPVLSLQVFYEGDSVRQDILRARKPGEYTLSVWADSLGKIKEVNGFVYYSRPQAGGSTLLIDQVRLMRYHAKGDSASHSLRPVRNDILSRPLQTATPQRIK